MSAASNIYDFSTPIEETFAFIFSARGMNCYSPLGESILNEAANDAPPDLIQQFQKKRPRVEILLIPGAGLGHLRPRTDNVASRITPGFLRDNSHRANMILWVVTRADILEHRAYIAQVRCLLEVIAFEANASGKMAHHTIQTFKVTGEQPASKAGEGIIEATINCELEFSVKESAWTAFDAEMT